MKYRIAELNIEMNPRFRTAVQAQPYAAEWTSPRDFAIQVDSGAVLAAHPELETEDVELLLK